MYEKIVESSRFCAMGYNGACDGCIFCGKSNDKDGECYQQLHKAAADAIEKLTGRNVGKWIIKDNPGTGWYRVTCSACGEDVTSTAPVIGFFPNAKITWNYCPECGSYNGDDDDV